MSRLCTSVTLVVFSLCANLLFGQVASKRIDTSNQELRWMEGGAVARDYSNPTGNGATDFKKKVSDQTYASYTINKSAASGASTATHISQFLAWTPFAWGTVGIDLPQVEFSFGTIESAHASSSDPYAGAFSSVWFGHDSVPCRAYSKYEVTGPANQAVGFNGEIDIIVHTVAAGDAGLDSGYWTVTCGPSSLAALSYGSNWAVNGVLYVGGVPQTVDEFWPLEINEVIFTGHDAVVGNTFELEATASDFGFLASAGYMNYSQSDLIGEVVLGAAYWLD